MGECDEALLPKASTTAENDYGTGEEDEYATDNDGGDDTKDEETTNCSDEDLYDDGSECDLFLDDDVANIEHQICDNRGLSSFLLESFEKLSKGELNGAKIERSG
ncbi:hypothetical protein Tco_1575622 [Tanacetum coccineum]